MLQNKATNILKTEVEGRVIFQSTKVQIQTFQSVLISQT